MNSNSIPIHLRQKIARHSKCIYSRAHGSTFSPQNRTIRFAAPYKSLAITSISGPKKVNISIFPQLYSKNDPEKPPHQVWGFFTFQWFVFFLIFAFSCLSLSSFPLLLDFLKPKSGPSNEVIGSSLWAITQSRRKRDFTREWPHESAHDSSQGPGLIFPVLSPSKTPPPRKLPGNVP